MSSRFVSAGAIDAATGEVADLPPPSTSTSISSSKKSQEWLAVQQQLDNARAARAADAAVGQNGERSLYDALQANKAAKQAAFEEASRIRNQFRALDDDEIDFLEGVRERKREEEERVRRETEDRLRAFRERQGQRTKEGGEREGGEGEGEEDWEEEVGWEVGGQKRKRGERDEGRKRVKGLVVKKKGEDEGKGGEKAEEGRGKDEVKPVKLLAPVKTPQAALPLDALAGGGSKKLGGLVDYGSSDED